MIHYLIVIPLILIIIYFQAKVFSQALAKIDVFKAIFPTNKLDYSIGRLESLLAKKRKKPQMLKMIMMRYGRKTMMMVAVC